MYCQLCWTVASIVVVDSKSITDAMACASRKLLRDLSEKNLIILSYTARIGGLLVGANPIDK